MNRLNFKVKELDNGWTNIMTEMLDDIWDNIIISQKDDVFTDGGYFDLQLDMDAGIGDQEKRKEILTRAAGYFGCHIHETNNAIFIKSKDHDSAFSQILQACTAVAVIIQERNR
ncbi:hypothetical protein GNF18_10320 [Ligilactobacillus pobuzihii]|uniref:hypothetical protein n=1 Tax=Ligilactobacillus pobuzihii TaxID=449659 RepID=UPI0019D31D0A|nr:hypothetical protein [Ligilactobacillus pobuzihii]MBN7275535.1 hypothetical protein [Ligilactobacillus pobuzihii]